MIAPTITLDGHVLNDSFAVSGIKRWFPSSRVTYDELDGRNGAVATSYAIGTRTVEFTLWAFGSDHGALRFALSQVVAWLYSATTHVLTFSDEDGFYRNVILDGEPQLDEYDERASLSVQLIQTDPYLYGETRQYDLTPDRITRVYIGTTAPPIIRIMCDEAQRNASSRMWGVSLGDGLAYLYVILPTAQSTAVVIDCDKRHVTIGGQNAMLTLNSDWPEETDLNPAAGATALNRYGGQGLLAVTLNQGTGTATVEVVERRI